MQQDNFGYIIREYSAEGAGCKAKCDVLYGDLAKAKCHTMYIKQPCGCTKSNCDCKLGSKCCQHNKQVPINIANCKKNVDARRAACKAGCVQNPSYEPEAPEAPIPPDKDSDVPDKADAPSKDRDGVKSKFLDDKTKKVLLYTGLAIGGIAGVSLIVWGIRSATNKS